MVSTALVKCINRVIFHRINKNIDEHCFVTFSDIHDHTFYIQTHPDVLYSQFFLFQQPQILVLKEGTDTSQGKPQLVSNINACQSIMDAVIFTNCDIFHVMTHVFRLFLRFAQLLDPVVWIS